MKVKELTHIITISESPMKPALPQLGYESSALFDGFRECDISAILDKASLLDYPARTWLYRQGEATQQFFLVESGLVRLSQLMPEGEDILVRFVKPGEVFGYLQPALDGPNMTSAQVIQQSRLAAWDRDVALQLLQSMPGGAVNLFNVAVRDALYFHDRTLRLLTLDVEHRVEWALSELVRTVGVWTPAGVLITNGIGQRELAELAGTTIFTVSRELTKLQRQGILEKQRGRITVLQPEKLSGLATHMTT